MDKSRTELLIGENGIEKLASKHVTIVGVGGVGGYAGIMLARAGIEKFTLIDFDKISSSNVNRQIIAYNDNVGCYKVDEMKDMFLRINDKIEVKTFAQRLTKENISSLIGKTDIVIDAIDSTVDKIELIAYCKQNDINIISAMGAGNRYDLPQFKLTDIFKTSDDGLAKVVRKGLRERGITSLEVVTSLSKAVRKGGTIGSISYYPAMLGSYISAVVVNKIIKGEL